MNTEEKRISNHYVQYGHRMRLAILTAIIAFVLLFVLTTFVPAPAARQRAEQEQFTAQEIERGLQLSLQRKIIYWTGVFLTLGFYTWLTFSGRGRRLTGRLAQWARGRWWLMALLIGGVCFAAQRILHLPLAVLGLENARQWGMTNQSLMDWSADYFKAQALSAVLGAILLIGLYALLRWFPRVWWALSAVLVGVLAMGIAFVLPVWITPLFNNFTPLEDEVLRASIEKMAAKAGVPVQDVLVVDASRQGNYTNAYFTGFGSTRRIVLYDTLLQSHPREEIISILGHEIGHWQHNHIMKGIALATMASLVGFFLLDRILRWAVHRPPFELRSIADPAGLPLILLLSTLAAFAILPVENGISRYFERQADLAALDLTEDPDVFIEAERRLARDNLSNIAPNPLSVWWFSTHPPAVERIEMARRWKAERNR